MYESWALKIIIQLVTLSKPNQTKSNLRHDLLKTFFFVHINHKWINIKFPSYFYGATSQQKHTYMKGKKVFWITLSKTTCSQLKRQMHACIHTARRYLSRYEGKYFHSNVNGSAMARTLAHTNLLQYILSTSAWKLQNFIWCNDSKWKMLID